MNNRINSCQLSNATREALCIIKNNKIFLLLLIIVIAFALCTADCGENRILAAEFNPDCLDRNHPHLKQHKYNCYFRTVFFNLLVDRICKATLTWQTAHPIHYYIECNIFNLLYIHKRARLPRHFFRKTKNQKQRKHMNKKFPH